MSFVAIDEAWVCSLEGMLLQRDLLCHRPRAVHWPQKPEPPFGPVLVTCSCCWNVFRYLENEIFRGQPRKNDQCNRSDPQKPKGDGALVVAASVVAGIRLQGEDVKPSPKLKSVIHDSLRLVRLLMAEIQK